jgi:hypothetical protein
VVASATAAAITPVGPRLAVQPFVVARRARDIEEWSPVHLLSWQALLLVGLALLLLKVPREERLFAVGVLGFACLAVRDVAPATILLAPLLARRLEDLLPASHARVPLAVPTALAAAALGLAVASLSITRAVSSSVPTALASQLDHDAGAHVLVDYDIGGLVTGQARHVSPAVDGRTDVYDPSWLHAYLQMTLLRGDWRPLLAQLHPDRALVQRDGGLAHVLTAAGWQVDQTEGDWGLLSAPGRTVPR